MLLLRRRARVAREHEVRSYRLVAASRGRVTQCAIVVAGQRCTRVSSVSPSDRRSTQQSARRALARGLSPAQATQHQRIARRAFPRSPRAMPAAAFLAFLRSVDGATDKDAPFFDGIAKALENNGLGNPSELAGCQYGDLDLGQSGALSASAKAHLRRALEKANAREVRRPRWFAGTRVALSAAEGGAECRERERAPGRPRAAPARVFAVGQ